MKPVFADAFFFFGVVNRHDQFHAEAIAAAQKHCGKQVTTGWVLTEFADRLAESALRHLVTPFIRRLSKDPRVQIIEVSEDLFQRGLMLYEERGDKGWTLTDCISFIVMTDLKITDALTGDHHFEQAGFRALLG